MKIYKQKKNPDDIEIYESLINIAESEYNEARDTYEKLLTESKLGMKRVQDLEKFVNALKGSKDIVLGYALGVYKKLGFVQNDSLKEEDEIRYIPMVFNR